MIVSVTISVSKSLQTMYLSYLSLFNQLLGFCDQLLYSNKAVVTTHYLIRDIKFQSRSIVLLSSCYSIQLLLSNH